MNHHHHQNQILSFQAVNRFHHICQIQGHQPTFIYDEPLHQRFRARLYVAGQEILHSSADEFFSSKQTAKEAICIRGIERLNSLFPSSSSSNSRGNNTTTTIAPITVNSDVGGSGNDGGRGVVVNWIGKLMGKSKVLYPSSTSPSPIGGLYLSVYGVRGIFLIKSVQSVENFRVQPGSFGLAKSLLCGIF